MPSHVQSLSSSTTSSGSTATFGGFAAVGAGNFVVAFLQVHNTTNTISSVAMGSNTLNVVSFLANAAGSNYSTFIAYGFNIIGGPASLVVNFSGAPSGTDHYMIFDEYSSTGTAIDGSNTTAGTGLTTESAPVTTTVNGDLIWTANGNCTSVTFPSGFTAENNDGTLQQYTADEVQATAGTITPTWTSSTTVTLVCGTLAIQPLAGACPRNLLLMGVGCSVGWRAALAWKVAKAIERNDIITRRGLVLPRRVFRK